MKMRYVSVVALVAMFVGLVPAGASSNAPRARGLVALLGLQALQASGYRSNSAPSNRVTTPDAWRYRADAPRGAAGATFTYVRAANGDNNFWYIGGVIDADGNVTGEVDKLNAVTNVWTPNVTALPIPTGGHCSVAAGRTIYVIGGTDVNQTNIGVQAYNTDTNSWSIDFDPFPSTVLPNGLATEGCGVLQGSIYVYGGGDPISLTPVGVTLKFIPNNPRGSQWQVLSYVMNHPRAGFGNAVDAAHGKIYTAGGTTSYDPTTNLPNQVVFVESFSPTTGWTSMPDLPQARTGAALFMYQNNTQLVITAGGVLTQYDGTDRCMLASNCSSWQRNISSLLYAVTEPAYAGVQNYLFVVGGLHITIIPPATNFSRKVQLGP